MSKFFFYKAFSSDAESNVATGKNIIQIYVRAPTLVFSDEVYELYFCSRLSTTSEYWSVLKWKAFGTLNVGDIKISAQMGIPRRYKMLKALLIYCS